MQLTLTTPALFFPAISLLFLSYTNKFLALAALVRSLHQEFETNPNCRSLTDQIGIIHRRLMLIKHMQGLGILSFIFCVLDMFLLYLGMEHEALLVFGGCLFFLLASLLICAIEIHISTAALDVELRHME
ncbi:DUF2721 domain-containing protein [Sansalvadorimonas sp. 2012CJ34-2]|uniref:DUF2721 domain-containing protein n=1 Tax=Parendozoicomonas callyspongiae TaxID=2942213 RepID=A0ABT0PHU7_9GAMM|nr:DUF2721 domain-containing protein [Sansalvadorimonas sp. 2012CJ34-2]MCL6270962.1 DUF2721 domain-containing protein [Sansalvadorimonas sp. 2012CJ34-2]